MGNNPLLKIFKKIILKIATIKNCHCHFISNKLAKSLIIIKFIYAMKAICVVILLLASVTLWGQENNSPEYLFNTNRIKVSGFGGPFVSFAPFEGGFGIYSGGGGAVLLNQTLYLGGYGMGVATDHDRDDINIDKDYKVAFGHGGLWLGYINNYHKMVHWGVSTKIGAGNFKIIDRDYDSSDKDKEYANDHVFVCLPQAELEVNITKWFKINLAVGYHFMAGFNEDEYYMTSKGKKRQNFEAKDYNGPIGTISFLFGGFGQTIN